MHRSGRDVRVGDLLRDRLERGQRPAELLPGGHVIPGQRQRPGHRAVYEGTSPRHGQLIQIPHALGRPEHGFNRRLVHAHRELRLPARARRPRQPHPRRPRSHKHDPGASYTMIMASFWRYLPRTGHDHGSGHEQEERLVGVGDAYLGTSDFSFRDRGGWDNWGWVGGLADGRGEGQLARRDSRQQLALKVGVAPAGHGQRAGHERGQGFNRIRRGVLAHLGQEHRGLGHAEFEQAGLGELLPGIRPGQHLGGQAGDRLLGLRQGEVHHRGRPRTRSATWFSRICVVPPAMDRHRVSRNS